MLYFISTHKGFACSLEKVFDPGDKQNTGTFFGPALSRPRNQAIKNVFGLTVLAGERIIHVRPVDNRAITTVPVDLVKSGVMGSDLAFCTPTGCPSAFISAVQNARSDPVL